MFGGDCGKRGNIAPRSDGDKRNGSMAWRIVVGLARFVHAVYLRGDESEVESNGECGEGLACLCFRGGDCKAACERFRSGGITLPYRVCGVAAALR